MLLLSLSAWAAKLHSLSVPWAALVPEEFSELDEDRSYTVLRLALQLASRFLSEHLGPVVNRVALELLAPRGMGSPATWTWRRWIPGASPTRRTCSWH